MLRSAARRARSAVSRPSAARALDLWSAYLAEVEPTLAAQPRVHRFAQVPLIADPRTDAAPLAVWIDGDGPAANRTRNALEQGTVGPAAILQGTLADALAGSRAERVLLIREGDVPAPPALERLGQAATMAPDAAVITCDEDQLGDDGDRHSPRLRPGPSPDRWLASDDSGAMTVVARDRAAAALSEPGVAGRANHALALTLGGRGGEHHAHVPLLLCHRASGARLPALVTKAVTEALRRFEPSARFEADDDVRRVRRPISGEPAVEIIICLRDKAQLTSRCVQSVLQSTNYEQFTITLVDNGSVETDTAEALRRLARFPRVRVRRDDGRFNFAALNNGAAADTDADVLVFLNNDTELIDGDWLEPMLEEALRPEVGAVAPMLLFEDGTVQHAGAALGMHGYAGHPFAGLAPATPTPFGRADGGTRNWLAVTAACMMVQRAKFEAVGGFDESFVVAGNDVDLCLRLTAAGHRSLCVPHVRLWHYEGRSRGQHIDPGDFAASERSYGAFRTVGDPFYNPSLSLRASDCRLRAPGEEVG
jgi:GT2 family glycosyltransferase